MFKKLLPLWLFALLSWGFAATGPDSTANAVFPQYQALALQNLGPFANLAGAPVSLGKPIGLWRITKATAMKYGQSKLMPDLLSPANSYLYPVLCNNKTILFLRINQLPTGKWVSAGVGYSQLVLEISDMQAYWPVAKGNVSILVENEVTKEILFSLTNLPQQNLTRFRFNDAAPQYENGVRVSKYKQLDTPDAEVARTIQVAWR
jgi:hypothetical protein